MTTKRTDPWRLTALLLGGITAIGLTVILTEQATVVAAIVPRAPLLVAPSDKDEDTVIVPEGGEIRIEQDGDYTVTDDRGREVEKGNVLK